MKVDWKILKIKGKKVEALVTIKEKDDRRKLKRLFNMWLKLNKAIKLISTRGINFPEAISENAFCLFFPCIRVVKLKKEKCSFDCLNLIDGKRIQIKAASATSDLSSFGPRSEYDELFFLDFSKCNGSFKIYKIRSDWVYKIMVNKNMTFKQQQKQGKRPRFSIIGNIIKPKSLKPIKTCKL